MTWLVRHRLKGDPESDANVTQIDGATPADAIAQVRAEQPEGHNITSIVRA